MTEQFYLIKPKFTFTELSINLMFSQSLQCYSQMISMLFLILGIYQNIINKDYDKLVRIWHEDFVHQIHEYCRCIGQPKWYYQILMVSIPRDKCCFWNIFR